MEELSQQTNPTADPKIEQELYRKASARASYKKHLIIYILVNLLLWIVWFFIFRNNEDKTFFTAILFVSFAWLVILIAHFFFVYKFNQSMIEKELKKLKKERKKVEEEVKKLKSELTDSNNNTDTINH